MSAYDQMSDHTILDTLATTYLAFLDHACDEKTGRFRNYYSYERRWSPKTDSEDCQGRAIWALGVAVSLSKKDSQVAMAMNLFERGLPVSERLKAPRSIAMALLGIAAYGSRFGGDRSNRAHGELLADRLQTMFDEHATDTWPWLEDSVTYDNARIPQAMIVSGSALDRKGLVAGGLRALEWLLSIQVSPEGHFAPIGNRGWYLRGERPAKLDQQPIEAGAMVDACTEAYMRTKQSKWARAAVTCFDWFLGGNDLRTAVYDYVTGGCCDGLGPGGVNLNQGAESTLAWLLALISLTRCQAVWRRRAG